MRTAKSYEEFLAMETCEECKVNLPGGTIYEITCDKCVDEKVVKKTKKEFIDEIDTDGNGHITHKEVEDYFGNKDK